MKEIVLPSIREETSDYDEIEKKIDELFRKEIYYPLLALLGESKNQLKNALFDLHEAIRSGRITFYRGSFTGRFNSLISKELKRLGAQWDRRQGSWKIPLSSLPQDIRQLISASEQARQVKFSDIDKKLAAIVPEKLSEKLKVSELFDATLWKVDKDFRKNVEKITVMPKLTDEQRKKIADDWQDNMRRYIKDWTEENIKSLRKQVQEEILRGKRYESLVDMIQKNYGVSQNKAKFLARQETSLLMAEFKEVRYKDAGSEGYYWGCVAGSPNHPVRKMHKDLEGKFFRWDNPPITNPKGARNHPGQDYNCRCFAKPVVRFK